MKVEKKKKTKLNNEKQKMLSVEQKEQNNIRRFKDP